MLFKDFRKTMEFSTADLIEFIDTNGAELEIDNLEDEALDNFDVVNSLRSGEVLEIILN